ncbi:MAG: type VI secretion system baseplate subunit TssF [Fuerstiella sp.]|jgi:type VI secretion system protein ImpG|nr:type VI secretion system baseplate subunit TssF [Fuerstiella sp.]MCP4507876.1 type VI secretion system baseplate subunit TssF [Fuerstiella sp.]MCP4784389.1 type VI secretion system baseplate subunit TssF [Fuerstiella sp.]MCP4853998.1 type VI secretion system baseplate subunit TssF [Fuerstiella sp.]MDG2126367.1 type VI secretion system baseplate subunit TssF [Fuerstiella sp.]
MSESLEVWYQAELDYFRHSASDFAERFPKIADRLSLSGSDIRDPHVERLIQAFAYLNARTRRKLDDSFPELADAMLGILYPHMLAPVPSVSVLRFGLNSSQKDQTAGHSIPVGTSLETEPIHGHNCQFKTCYPIKLFPLSTEAVSLLPQPFSGPSSPGKREAEAALRFEFSTLDPKKKLAEYSLNHFRFYINIANFEKAARLLEAVLTQTIEVVITGEDATIAADVLPAACIKPVGLNREDAVLPDNSRSFPGYRLLTEYFVLPQKFLFFDVTGITPQTLSRLGSKIQLTILLKEFPGDLENVVSVDTVHTGCTPVINLFERSADALPLTYRTSEYRIVPDARAETAMEVHSVNAIKVEDGNGDLRPFRRFYSVGHAQLSGDTGYWHITRRPGPVEGDSGTLNEPTEVYVSLVDPEFSPKRQGGGMLYASLTCFNRDLPEELSKQRTVKQLHFDIMGGRGPVSSIECLVTPTPTLRRHMGRRNLWPLVSQLSLNHLSLMESQDAVDAVREMLTLNDVKDSAQTRNLIDGLGAISSQSCVQRVNGAFARGTQIDLIFDDDNFAGDSVFLFSSILNQFFGMYTSINSFTKLTATTRRRLSRKQDTWTWPAQAGDKALI